MGLPKKKTDVSSSEKEQEFDDFLSEIAKDQTQTGIREKLEQAQKDADEITEPSVAGQGGTKVAISLADLPESEEVNGENKSKIPEVSNNEVVDNDKATTKAEAFQAEAYKPEISKVEVPKPKVAIDEASQAEVDEEKKDVAPMIHPVGEVEADEKTVTKARQLAEIQKQSQKSNEPGKVLGAENTSTGTSNLVSASIKQANHLKIAQDRINDLEDRVLKLKQGNESLSVSSDSLNKQVVDLSNKLQISEGELKQFKENISEDKESLTKSISDKKSEINLLKTKVETLEERLKQENYNVRSRERELENRLELARSEKNTLLKDKDSTILAFKRQIDKLNFDIENYMDQQKGLKAKILASDERIKKSVRALRVALGILEGTDE